AFAIERGNHMARVAVFLWLMLAGVVAAQQAPQFTRKSEVMEGKELTPARRHFQPGARTYWDSPGKGPVWAGGEGPNGKRQKGGPVRERGVGESEYAGPDVAHWHGAAADQPLVQINVGFGGGTKWMDAVTDAEYGKR